MFNKQEVEVMWIKIQVNKERIERKSSIPKMGDRWFPRMMNIKVDQLEILEKDETIQGKDKAT